MANPTPKGPPPNLARVASNAAIVEAHMKLIETIAVDMIDTDRTRGHRGAHWVRRQGERILDALEMIDVVLK